MPAAFLKNWRTGQYDPSLNGGIGSGQGQTDNGAGSNVNYNGSSVHVNNNGNEQPIGYDSSGKPIFASRGGTQSQVVTGGQGTTYDANSGGAGYGQSGGTSSLATGGAVGSGAGAYSGDKQLAQIRDDFRRMTEQGISSLNEDLSGRGIFSSGVGANLANNYRTQMGQQEGSAIERLQNDILGRNQSYELAKSQAEWQKQLAMMGGGGGTRYGNAGQDQDLMALFQQMMGGGGGGQVSGGSSGMGGASVAGGSTGAPKPMTYGSPEWHAEQARIKAINDARAASAAGYGDANNANYGYGDTSY